MKCPHCQKEIEDQAIRQEAGRLGGRKSKRKDGGGPRCECGKFKKATEKLCSDCLRKG